MNRNELLEKYSEPIPVLNHGEVMLVDVMGDDSAITDAARVSYAKGTKSIRQNRGLIRYLMRHRHMSPLEMCEVKFRLKLPLFVFAQVVRHRTANVNAQSHRYSEVVNEFYVPDSSRVNPQHVTSRQSSDEDTVLDDAEHLRQSIISANDKSFREYARLLERGLAREVSRSITPTGTYTEVYWKTDLRNLLHFIQLRAENHAQYEIRRYAEAMTKIVKDWVPLVWEAFEDYVLNAVTFSGPEVEEMKRFLFYVGERKEGRIPDSEIYKSGDSGLSTGELEEFAQKLVKTTYLDYRLWTDFKDKADK